MAMTMDAAEDREKQRMEALGTANSVRIQRADLKDRVKLFGGPSIIDALECPPEYAEGMKVSELLKAQHRWGETRVRKLLTRLVISESRTLGGLTERQRRLLVSELEAPPPHRRCARCDGLRDDGAVVCAECWREERREEPTR